MIELPKLQRELLPYLVSVENISNDILRKGGCDSFSTFRDCQERNVDFGSISNLSICKKLSIPVFVFDLSEGFHYLVESNLCVFGTDLCLGQGIPF